MRTRTLSRISIGVRTGRRLSICCAALACASVLSAQSAGGAAGSNEPVTIESRKPAGSAAKVVESRPSNIKVDKTLVLINVTVTDPLNRFVTGLEKEHFRLYEDKIEQTITQFSSEDAPISIG
jgi:uncharacterized protein (DUF1499 family)